MRIVVATFTLAIVLAAMAPLAADDVVEIRLRSRYYSEPATVQFIVAIDPNADNRLLRIVADGDLMFRSTEVDLSGATDKRFHTIEFKNLPAGSYELRAEVRGPSAPRGFDVQGLTVMGR